MSSSASTKRADASDGGRGPPPVTVGEASEIPVGERGFYTINGAEIAIFNVEGELYAMENSCPHMGGPLGEGKLLRTDRERTNPVSRFQDFDPRKRGESRTPTESTGTTARPTIACPHHGWEFDLAEGTPLFPANRGVRTYPVRVEDGLIKLDAAVEARLPRPSR
jgi:nitrite reductase (NADH) small subunit